MDAPGVTPEHVGGTLGGIAGFWLLAKKVLLKTALDTTSQGATEAEHDILRLLREEVTRMAESNKVMAELLSTFQRDNINLKKEISILHDNINQLSERLSRLGRIQGVDIN